MIKSQMNSLMTGIRDDKKRRINNGIYQQSKTINKKRIA